MEINKRHESPKIRKGFSYYQNPRGLTNTISTQEVSDPPHKHVDRDFLRVSNAPREFWYEETCFHSCPRTSNRHTINKESTAY